MAVPWLCLMHAIDGNRCHLRFNPCILPAFCQLCAGTREQGSLTLELKKVIEALQDSMTLTRLLLRGQLRPVSSSASTKRLGEYRRVAIEHYYGSHTDLSKIRCMVTGEEVDSKQITAGHIYRQGWQTGLLVSILALYSTGLSYTPCKLLNPISSFLLPPLWLALQRNSAL